MVFEKLIYFSVSGLLFVLACRPHDKHMAVEKSLFMNITEIVKEKKPGYQFVLASSINLVVSIAVAFSNVGE